MKTACGRGLSSATIQRTLRSVLRKASALAVAAQPGSPLPATRDGPDSSSILPSEATHTALVRMGRYSATSDRPI